MVKTTDEFGVFFRESGPRRSSVIVNLTIGERAPLAHNPTLLRISIPVPTSKAHGWDSSRERHLLDGLDHDLVNELTSHCQACFVARQLMPGLMRFYFYVPSGTNPEPSIAKVLKEYPRQAFRVSRTHDPEWTIYFDELYPNRAEFQLLNNHQRQALAAQRGDNLAEPRPVCHWVYFPTEDTRDHFLSQIQDHGFRFHLCETHNLEFPGCRYCVELARMDRADDPHLDELVLWLYREAEECGGFYDSFEAESLALAIGA